MFYVHGRYVSVYTVMFIFVSYTCFCVNRTYILCTWHICFCVHCNVYVCIVHMFLCKLYIYFMYIADCNAYMCIVHMLLWKPCINFMYIPHMFLCTLYISVYVHCKHDWLLHSVYYRFVLMHLPGKITYKGKALFK